jgi:hypothetical protein
MHNNEVVDTARPTRAVRVFKWLLFGVEIFLLWVLCNTLFLVPGPYRGDRGIIIAVSAVLAALVSWTSGRLFQRTDGAPSLSKTFSSPPVVICIFVLAVATIVMTVAILATR